MDHLSPQQQNGTSSVLTPHPSTSCLRALPTYHRSQIPSLYKEPFIMSGYRKPNPSFFECIRYAFVCHNDVWNFWSHFLPLCIWLSWLYYLSYHYDFSDPYYYPLLCFWLGGCSYVLFSSIAHMFACKSATVRSTCFMFDYLGISVYVAGGGIYSFHHQQPLSSPLYQYEFPVLCLHLLASVSATLISSLTRFYWLKHRFLIRALAYVPSYLSSIVPFMLRMHTCASTGEDCIYATLHLHFISVVLTWVLLFFFVSKVPERFAPGKFDILFQSHTLFHFFSVVLTSIQMYMFPIDTELRKVALLTKIAPSFETVYLPFLAMIGIGLLQVGLFALLLVKGVLTPNKVELSHQNKEHAKHA